MAPLADVPRKTAGGVGALVDKDCAGTGTIPRACSVGNDETGSCTGIEVHARGGPVGAGACVLEAGVIGDVVVEGAEAEPIAGVVATDSALVVEIDVARAGGTYCVMVELRGTE